MSEDYNVGKVSSGLRKRRFAEKQKHTENFRQYLGEMWNSDDVQFLAIGKKGHTFFDSFQRRYWCDQINLSFFGYYHHYWTMRKENRLDRPVNHIPIRPEQAAGLRDFLVNKPANETFILPYPRGDYHLSFEKRSLFGPTELKWIFLNHKEEWDKALLLPRSEKNRTRKGLKLDETRQQLWFAADQSDKLIPYLDAVIPTYTFLR